MQEEEKEEEWKDEKQNGGEKGKRGEGGGGRGRRDKGEGFSNAVDGTCIRWIAASFENSHGKTPSCPPM